MESEALLNNADIVRYYQLILRPQSVNCTVGYVKVRMNESIQSLKCPEFILLIV